MEEYMKALLEQIRCKPAKKLVEQEIRGHILEQYEENLDKGMEETLAMEEAVKDMGNPIETGIALDAIHKPQISWGMIGILAVLSFFSILIQVLIGRENPELGNSYIFRHIFHVVLGLCLMLAVYRLDYSFLGKHGKKIAAVGGALMFSAIFFGGAMPVNGSSAWLQIGILPSVSLTAVLFLAVPVYGGILYSYYGRGYKALLKAVLWMLLPVVLGIYMLQPLFAGMLLILQGILLSTAVGKGWFQVRKFPALTGIWSGILFLPALVLGLGMKLQWFAPYQMERLAVYLGQKELPQNSMYYFLRNYMGESRLLGPGNFSGTLMENVESYNGDCIFPFISAKYGILAAVLLVALVLAVAVKGFAITRKQKNQLGRMVGFACVLVILGETCINLLVCFGFIPPIVSSFLPFFSSGGSNLVVFYMLLGLMLSVYRYKNLLPAEKKRKQTAAGQISA